MKSRFALLCSLAFCVGGLPAHAAEPPITIGMIVEATGANAEAGQFQMNGANLALKEVNEDGGVLGRKLEMKTEDNQSTNPGSVLAFSKLVSGGDLAAIIATVRSTQVQAVLPTVKKNALPVMFGGTDAGLTLTHNPWVFRARPNDSYSAKAIASYGVNTLKRKKWAIVYSTDAFGNGGNKALTKELKGLGVTPVTAQGFTSNSQDFTQVILAIKSSGADVVASYITNSIDDAIFGKQLRQLGVKAEWVGSPSLSSETAIKLGGSALYGTYSVADFVAESSPEAKSYAQKYQAAYKVQPDFYSAWVYDSVKLLALAMNTAKSTKPEAVADALRNVKGYKGAEGTYNFDKNGDGLHGYNIVQNKDGKIVFINHIEF
jgi:branched-chain amino acid transport system substrate-binding protein